MKKIKFEILIALFLGILVAMSFSESFAAAPYSNDPTASLAQIYVNLVSSPVGTASWVAVASSATSTSSHVLSYNSGTMPLMLGVGIASNAVTSLFMIPKGATVMVPSPVPANKSLFVKSKDSVPSAGILEFTLFQ